MPLATLGKARWIQTYLTRNGVPGIRARAGHLHGLRGYEGFTIDSGLNQGNGRGTNAPKPRIDVGNLMWHVFDRTGKRPIAFRSWGRQSPEHVLVVMRLPDWTEMVRELINHDPGRWLGEE